MGGGPGFQQRPRRACHGDGDMGAAMFRLDRGAQHGKARAHLRQDGKSGGDDADHLSVTIGGDDRLPGARLGLHVGGEVAEPPPVSDRIRLDRRIAELPGRPQLDPFGQRRRFGRRRGRRALAARPVQPEMIEPDDPDLAPARVIAGEGETRGRPERLPLEIAPLAGLQQGDAAGELLLRMRQRPAPQRVPDRRDQRALGVGTAIGGIRRAPHDREARAQRVDSLERGGGDRREPPVLVGDGDQLLDPLGRIDSGGKQRIAGPEIDRVGLDCGIVAAPGDAQVETVALGYGNRPFGRRFGHRLRSGGARRPGRSGRCDGCRNRNRCGRRPRSCRS